MMGRSWWGHGPARRVGGSGSIGMRRRVRTVPGMALAATRMALAATLCALLLCSALAQPAGAAMGAEGWLGYSLAPSKTMPYTPCPSGGSVMVECDIVVDPRPVKTSSGYQLAAGGPLYEGGGELGGYDPKDLQSAYDIPTSGGTRGNRRAYRRLGLCGR